eukprot:TRINITY_DN5216_c0_g1_i1.p1 TRINITY_DN5216_c0_g1~~TRINITY_DN5216_c0_g1_i1.p1  ORF type:complete len:478 (+),score=88.89 TRINITY_DN5216_c0_g1_i1:167-1600(+)
MPTPLPFAAADSWGEGAATPAPPPSPPQPQYAPGKDQTPPLWLICLLTLLHLGALPFLLHRCRKVHRAQVVAKRIAGVSRRSQVCLYFHAYLSGGGTVVCVVISWALFGTGVRGGALLVLLTLPLLWSLSFYCVLAAATPRRGAEEAARTRVRETQYHVPGLRGGMLTCEGEEYYEGDLLRYAFQSANKYPFETGHSCAVRTGPPLGGLRLVAAAPTGICRLWYPMQLWAEAVKGGKSVVLGPFESEEHVAFLCHDSEREAMSRTASAVNPAANADLAHVAAARLRSMLSATSKEEEEDEVAAPSPPAPLPDPPPLPIRTPSQQQQQQQRLSPKKRRPPALAVPAEDGDFPIVRSPTGSCKSSSAATQRGITTATVAGRYVEPLYFSVRASDDRGAAAAASDEIGWSFTKPPSPHVNSGISLSQSMSFQLRRQSSEEFDFSATAPAQLIARLTAPDVHKPEAVSCRQSQEPTSAVGR